jgi:ribose/xylose/arabinose/galactoside ABC-type transport system permease subunit
MNTSHERYGRVLNPIATSEGLISLPRSRRKRTLILVRTFAVGTLVVAAIATPGFFSATSLLSLLTTMSFIGCVAAAMTFITLSGNVLSFCLGATLSATTIVFMACLPVGLAGALVLAFLFSAVLTGAQGWVIGYFRANSIIVSMAVLALIYGFVALFTAGRGIYPEGSDSDILKGRIAGVPIPIAAFLGTVVVGQLILSFTRFGRNLFMVGSNHRAALAAGIGTWRTVTGAYVVAGLFTAVSAVLMAARYASGDMEHGLGYDYHAISAVVVGGTAIEGGRGSVVRTLLGTVIISVVQGMLLLWGFSTPMQYLTIGVIVLGVIMLHTLGESR